LKPNDNVKEGSNKREREIDQESQSKMPGDLLLGRGVTVDPIEVVPCYCHSAAQQLGRSGQSWLLFS
jgi:hypothetical protein